MTDPLPRVETGPGRGSPRRHATVGNDVEFHRGRRGVPALVMLTALTGGDTGPGRHRPFGGTPSFGTPTGQGVPQP